MNVDLLDMAYINSLPQPLFVREGGSEWPVHDICVQTGLMRIDACGMLDVTNINKFCTFRDADGFEHSADGFYLGATPEDRIPLVTAQAVLA